MCNCRTWISDIALPTSIFRGGASYSTPRFKYLLTQKICFRPRHERQMCKTSPRFARWFHRLLANRMENSIVLIHAYLVGQVSEAFKLNFQMLAQAQTQKKVQRNSLGQKCLTKYGLDPTLNTHPTRKHNYKHKHKHMHKYKPFIEAFRLVSRVRVTQM